MTDSLTDTPQTPQPPADAAPPGEAYIVDEATDAVLRLHLDSFEGPFEVLLYLIRSQEIDVFDIPVATITEQYLRFLDLMREENLEVAGDFLVMAATLIQMKARMLIPPSEVEEEEEEEEEEEDPRVELVEKLLEYRKFRDVAERLERLEEERAHWFTRKAKPDIEPADDEEEEYLDVSLHDLIAAFKGVLRFMSDDLFHNVSTEHHSVDDKIAEIEESLAVHGRMSWTDLFQACRDRVELVCCFLAILELCRMGRIRARQHRIFDEIRLVPAGEPVAG